MSRFGVLVVLTVLLLGVSRAVHGQVLVYDATLTGPSESPPNASPGTGFAEVDYNPVAHTLHVHVTFSGLLAPSTASHIHAATPAPGVGTAPVATQLPAFPGFPLGVTSGTYDDTFDTTAASTYNPAFLATSGGTAAGAEAVLAAAMAADEAYLNIHSTMFPSGEIRGFLLPAATVPEPSIAALACLAAVGVMGFLWRGRIRTD